MTRSAATDAAMLRAGALEFADRDAAPLSGRGAPEGEPRAGPGPEVDLAAVQRTDEPPRHPGALVLLDVLARDGMTALAALHDLNHAAGLRRPGRSDRRRPRAGRRFPAERADARAHRPRLARRRRGAVTPWQRPPADRVRRGARTRTLIGAVWPQPQPASAEANCGTTTNEPSRCASASASAS